MRRDGTPSHKKYIYRCVGCKRLFKSLENLRFHTGRVCNVKTLCEEFPNADASEIMYEWDSRKMQIRRDV